MDESRLTILICARNAAPTIERALASALAQGPHPVIVVDDASQDATAALAERAGPRVRVIRLPRHRSLGFARQAALEQAGTPWLMWVDADDEALPGRAEVLLAEAGRTGADIVFDDAELFDGATGTRIRDLPVPGFIRDDPRASRQFERNFVPGLGWGLMRTSLARRVGYDLDAHGVEDFDFCLRAIRAGARFACRDGTGYRQFAYPASVSRDIYGRRGDLVRLYRKHDCEEVRRIVLAAGWPARVAEWVLLAMAVFREEFEEALRIVARLAAETPRDDRVLEPRGPYPVPERWRVSFQRGTLLALLGCDREAEEALRGAAAMRASADTSNNLGVVLRRLGREAEARECFARASVLFPGFVDATRNLADPGAARLTPLPLRLLGSRSSYG